MKGIAPFLCRDSHDPETQEVLARLLDSRPVDFLMIDGDHTHDGVAGDYRMCAPFVVDGGLICFHDIPPHPQVPECNVDRLWAELKQTHEHLEFTDPAHDRGWGQWGSIGVLVHHA